MKKKIKENITPKATQTPDIIMLKKRIKNVCGQLDGISNMIDEGKDCISVVTQLKAARGGIEKILEIFLETNLRSCISKTITKDKKKEIEKMLSELTK